ncbi:hypothetical protein [Escherichia phage vB-Eco-KMB43]|nr:hypothetical protein [Escherichia phage vB-Eco-KMB43]
MSKLFETPREILIDKLKELGFKIKDATKYSRIDEIKLHSLDELVEYVAVVADPQFDVIVGDVEYLDNVYSFFTYGKIVSVKISFCENVEVLASEPEKPTDNGPSAA